MKGVMKEKHDMTKPSKAEQRRRLNEMNKETYVGFVGGAWTGFSNGQVEERSLRRVDSDWLLAQLKTYTTRMVETAAKKNADYAGASPKPFANFSHVEDLGIATTEQGFLTRMTDKLCRVATFAKKGVLQVSDESVEDTLLDLANYSLLMAAYIKAKKAGML